MLWGAWPLFRFGKYKENYLWPSADDLLGMANASIILSPVAPSSLGAAGSRHPTDTPQHRGTVCGGTGINPLCTVVIRIDSLAFIGPKRENSIHVKCTTLGTE